MITLKQSEWLWAINRGKVVAYYDKHFTPGAFTKHVGGWLVYNILSSSDYLLKEAFQLFNMNFQLLIMTNYPLNMFGTKQELSREEINWLIFSATAHQLTKNDLHKIIEGDWENYWDQLDKEYGEDKVIEEELK